MSITGFREYTKKSEIPGLNDAEKNGYFVKILRENPEGKSIVFRTLNIFRSKVAALEKIPNFQAETLNRVQLI